MGEEISCTELLQRVYDCLFYEQVEEMVEFEKPIDILVADDSDHHRIREGYLRYTGGKVVALEDDRWFVGKGVPYGSYPADRYLGDLRVWTGSRPLGIENFPGFRNSALIITRNNNIGISSWEMFTKLSDLLTKIDDYDLTPNEQYTVVRPEFVDVVVERIEGVMEKNSRVAA